jgi:hypothetical protein
VFASAVARGVGFFLAVYAAALGVGVRRLLIA